MALPTRTQHVCLEILQSLMEKPCAHPFLDPVDPQKNNLKDYFSVVKHPIDLHSIYKKMLNNEYANISQWDKEMSLIWSNAEKYFKKGSYISILANELHRVYSKEYEKIKLLRLVKWSRVIFNLNNKLDKLYENPPPFVGAVRRFPDKNGETSLHPFSEDELNTFIHMSKYVNNATDAAKIAKIINFYQPEYELKSTLNQIEVNDLDVKTLYAIREFLIFRVAEMNILYQT